MATQDTLIEVPMGAGTQQDADTSVVQAPGLLRLENAFLNKKGVVKKRPGVLIEGSFSNNNVEVRDIFEDRGTTVVSTTSGTLPLRGSDLRRTERGSYYPATVDEFSADITSLTDPSMFVRGEELFIAGLSGTNLILEVRNAKSGILLRPQIVITASSAIGRVHVWATGSVVVVIVSGASISSPYYVATLSSVLSTGAVSWATSAITHPAAFAAIGSVVFPTDDGLGFCFALSTLLVGTNVRYVRFADSGAITQNTLTTFDHLGAPQAGPMAGCMIGGIAYVAVLCKPGSATLALGRALVRHVDVASTWSTLRWVSSDVHPDVYPSLGPRGRSGPVGIAVGPYTHNGTQRLGVWICSGCDLERPQPAYHGGGTVTLGRTFAVTLTYTNLAGQGDVSGVNTVDVVWNHYLGSPAFPIPGTQNHGVVVTHAGWLRNVRFVPGPDLGEIDSIEYGDGGENMSPNGASLVVFPTQGNDARIRVAARFGLGSGGVQVFGGSPGVFTGAPLRGPVMVTNTNTTHDIQYCWVAPPLERGDGFSGGETMTARITLRPPKLRRTLAGNLVCPAGVPSGWDGQWDWELCPHFIPKSVFFDRRSTIGGPRQQDIRVVFSERDERGQVRRSAPSNLSYVYVGGENSGYASWTRSAFGKIGGKDSVGGPWTSEVYTALTQTDPTSYHFLSRNSTYDPTCPTMMEGSAAIVVDTDNPLMYTTGGILETTLPPSFLSVAEVGNRLWGAAGNYVWYSKPIVDGEAPAFNGNLVVRIPDEGGKITAIVGMDDKLVVFRERAVYVVYGTPANSVGTGENLRVQRLPGDIGCLHSASAIGFPGGVLFLSERGFHAISRGLDMSYVGGGVEDTMRAVTTLPVIRWSVHDPITKTIRIRTAGTWELVWDYETGQWSHFTGISGESAAEALTSGFFYGQTATNSVFLLKESPTVGYLIATDTPIVTRLRTGWINTAGIQGFQRIKRAGFLLRQSQDPSNPILLSDTEVRLYHDNDLLTPASTHTLLGANMRSAASELFTPMNVHVVKQKCASLSIEFIEKPLVVGQTTYNCINFALSGLTLLVGAKRGPNKHIRAGRKV